MKREQSIIQTRVALLIALLAVARKFIILDLNTTTADQLLGLGAVTLVLGDLLLVDARARRPIG